MVGILQWPFGPVDVISLIATWRWKRCHQRDTNTGCVCFTLRQGIPWLHVHLQSACGRVAYSYKSPTNLAGNFLHMTCGTLWICELKLKKWPIFSKKKPRPSTTIMSGTPRVKVTSSAILPRFLDGPLGQCWGGPYWGAMVTDALLMDHIISKLGKGYRFFFSVRETIFTWNDSFDFICMWCVDHDVRKLRFCDSFLMFFFQPILDPENRLKTQNRLLKKLQRKSRKNATVAFWETKRPPMWSQTQTWVFLVLVDPWKFTHIDMLLFCTYFFLIQLKTLECYILPHLILSWIGLHWFDWNNLRPGESRPCFCWSKSDLLSHDHRGYLGIPGDTWVGMTGCARFPTKTRLEPRQLPRSFSYSAYCSSL